MEETGVPGENHRRAASHWQIWSHNVSSTSRLESVGFAGMPAAHIKVLLTFPYTDY